MLSYRGSETIRDLTTVGYFVNYIIALNGFFYYYLCVCVSFCSIKILCNEETATLYIFSMLNACVNLCSSGIGGVHFPTAKEFGSLTCDRTSPYQKGMYNFVCF